MNFKAYNICYLKDNMAAFCNITDSRELFKKLNKLPKVEEGLESYAPIEMHQYENYILGTLAQSYFTVLTKFDGEGKKEKELDDNVINDKIIFFINTEEAILYVQGKLYPTTSLNKKLTLIRITNILSECLELSIVLQPAKIDYTVQQMVEIFRKSFVKRVIFKNMRGIELPMDVVLHNPRADLDEAVAESWNTYSKNTIDYVELRAQEYEQLNKNPIAKIGVTLAEIGNPEGKPIINEIDLIDDGQKVIVKPSGNDTKVIYVPKKILEDSYEVYDKILKKEAKDYTGRF